jgi:hypothetical protein
VVVILKGLYEAYEAIDQQFIRDCNIDSGIMRNFAENCSDPYMREFAEHFIRVNEIEVSNLMEEMKNDRLEAARLERIQG